MPDTSALAEQFFSDCKQDNRVPNWENLKGWLWHTCPASLRVEVMELIQHDPRYQMELQKKEERKMDVNDHAIDHDYDESAGCEHDYIADPATGEVWCCHCGAPQES
jgi:hypothetical protein